MISKFQIGSNQETFGVQSFNLPCTTANVPSEDEDICACAGVECERNLDVFADLNDSSEKKNDKTSFLFKVFVPTDTGTMSLFKNGVEIAQLNNNNYGTYYALGNLGSSYGQQFYLGYLVDWNLVLGLHGVGYYEIKANLTIFGLPKEILSEKYNLQKYSDEAVDGSVKITTFQNGNIESSPFDYTNMNWYQQIRISGIFWNKQSEIITDNYFTSNRTITQIQDSIKYTYELCIEFVQDSVSKFIIENAILSNEIYITDYNFTNTTDYVNYPVNVEEITDTTELYKYNGRSHTIKFTDRTQNIRKRNYK